MRQTPEEIFLTSIKKLITNLLVDNMNYKNGHYSYDEAYRLRIDTQERAKYVLAHIEDTEHLIKEK